MIDGSLSRLPEKMPESSGYSWDGKRRIGKSAAENVLSIIPKEGIFYLNALSVTKTWRYFSLYVDGFDPTKEGEFNRNYLVHGVESKPVTRVVCMKLICLLDAVVRLVPKEGLYE